MRILYAFICFLLTQQAAFCQTENKIPTLIDIEKANGKIKIETYYPVDTTIYLKKIVYFDSALNVTTRRSEYMYFLSQTISFDEWKIARLMKRKAFAVQLNSTDTIKKMYDGLEKQYICILNAHFTYKRLFSRLEYSIENGFVTQIKKTNRKGTKIKFLLDYSGLYVETNKTWPLHTVYRKNGNVERIVRVVYKDQMIHTLVWKPE